MKFSPAHVLYDLSQHLKTGTFYIWIWSFKYSFENQETSIQLCLNFPRDNNEQGLSILPRLLSGET